MAIIREGRKTVLMIVDVQVGVMRGAWDAARIISNIVKAVEKARSQGIPVIWVQHAGDDLVYGSPDWEWVPELVPTGREIRIYKKFNSSFEQTSLEDALARMDATHIVLAGAATNWCIRATVYAALERGYDLTLVKDGHTTVTIDYEQGHKIEAENVIIEANITVEWLSYPGRTSRAVNVEELDLSA